MVFGKLVRSFLLYTGVVAFCLLYGVTFSYAYSYRIYIVRKGDTLIKISKALGVPKVAIERANRGVNWLRIIPGERIRVPARRLRSGFGRVGNGYYVVKSGDSLRSIAKRFGVSLETIEKLNPKISNVIYPGEVIFLPFSAVKRFIHKASSRRISSGSGGRPLAELEKSFHSSIKGLKPLKGVTVSLLHLGDLFIVGSSKVSKAKVAVKSSGALKGSGNRSVPHRTVVKRRRLKFKKPPRPGTIGDGYYVVKKGDTLSSIAAMFGLTLKELMKLNPGVSSLIRPGEIIYVPESICRKIKIAERNGIFISPRYLHYSMVYRVKPGDSLWKISHKFKVDVEILRLLNNLHGNIIRVGQVLFVPNIKLKAVKKMELELAMLRAEREAVVRYAERFVGDPYVWGGTSLRHGVDCSGFVQQVFRRFHIYLPRTAQEQYYSPIGVRVKLSQLKPGDLLFFHTMPYTYVTHVAIYIGNGRIIQALNRRRGVVISKLDGYYLRHFIGAKRIIGARIRFIGYEGSRNRSG